jgi:WD40 repeat protein
VKGVAFVDDGRTLTAVSNAFLRNVPGTAPRWDGKRIYSWSVKSAKSNDTIILKDSRTDDLMKYAGSVAMMAHSPKADLVGLALSGDRPVVIDMKARKPRYVPELEKPNSHFLAFSPDGNYLAACSWVHDHTPRTPSVKLFRADTGKFLAESAAGGVEAVRIAYSPDGLRLVVGGKEGKVVFITSDLKDTNPPIPVTNHPVTAIAYSPKADVIAAAAGRYNVEGDSRIFLIDPKQQKVIRSLEEKLTCVNAVAFSPDGKLLAVAYGTSEGVNAPKPMGGVLIYETETWNLIKRLP